MWKRLYVFQFIFLPDARLCLPFQLSDIILFTTNVKALYKGLGLVKYFCNLSCQNFFFRFITRKTGEEDLVGCKTIR